MSRSLDGSKGQEDGPPATDGLGADVIVSSVNRDAKTAFRRLGHVVPQLDACQSTKWIKGIEPVAGHRRGTWELLRCHNRGDRRTEVRFG